MSNELFVCRKILPLTRRDNCHCTVLDLKTFFKYNNIANCSELVRIMARGDLEALKRHIDDRRETRIIDKFWNSPLHLTIIFNNPEIFDYLMSMKKVNVNGSNCYGQTALHLAAIGNYEYYATQLLKKGADVNQPDDSRCTPLQAAATKFCPEIFDMLIESGAYINSQNLLGKTALYHACQYGGPDNIYMVLYYGASASITDFYGVLPFAAAMQQVMQSNLELTQSLVDCHEVLFYHTFEKKQIRVNLCILTVAMKINSPLFVEILKKIDPVNYSKYDLMELCRCVINIAPKYFRMLVQKYPYMIREMLQTPADLHYSLKIGNNVDHIVVKLMNFMTMLFKYRPSYNFVKGSMNFSYFIAILTAVYKEGRVSMEMLSQMVYLLYSYGLPCELAHIVSIYENCGFCEILKFALDLDMVVTYQRPKAVMPYLIYDINLTIDKFMRHVRRPSKEYKSALKFFSSPNVLNFFASRPGFKKKLDRMPKVPSLIELSRDVARKNIIETFEIKRTRDFYRFIKRMPINEVYKKILTYERELYRV